MRPSIPQGLADDTAKWFSQLELDDAPTPVDPAFRKTCLTVCSVLAQFPIDGLKGPSGPFDGNSLEQALGPDLVALPNLRGTPQEWTLASAARAEGLSSQWTLSSMWSTRQLNKIEPLPIIQLVFDEFLQGDHSACSSDNPARLEAALQVTEWLSPFDSTIPPVKAVERQLSRRRVLQSMERITRGFMGRTAELQELRAFVGVLDPQSPAEAAARYLREIFKPQEQKAPFLIWGIGGIGKSTLLAEFIRQHQNSPVPIPYVYLDFDNPRLNVTNLATLINEMADQLEAQYPGSNWQSVRDSVNESAELIDSSDYDSGSEAYTLTTTDLAATTVLRRDSSISAANEFAQALRRTMESSTLEKMMHVADYLPFLLVLDTFEEVQKRGLESAGVLWTFLSYLQQAFPLVRIVISGRAPVPQVRVNGRPAFEYRIREFDESSALSLLMQAGVADINLARMLYKQVGGNPLSLKLAAQVVKSGDSGARGIEGLKTSSYLIFSASETVIQGQLYRRILLRIKDDDVRALAHPGLVVRRLTAPIIKDVLAVPCGLGEITEKRSEQLFDELKKQVDLVTPDGDALRHQQDVRRVMLKLLEEERPDKVHEIHQRAFDYYSTLAGTGNDTVAETEQLYHALQLALDASLIRKLWSADAAESLLSSIDEFPPVSQLLVYELTNTTPSADLRKLADLDQWERVVEPKCRSAIRFGNYDESLKLLSERQDRTVGSALYAIEATCLMFTRQQERALALLQKGIDSAQSVNRMDRLCELWRLRGDSLRQQGQIEDADHALATAQELAGRIGSAVLQLQIFVSRVALSGPPVAELNDILARTSDTDFASVRTQIRGVFRTYGQLSDPLLRKGLRTLELGGTGGLTGSPVYGSLVESMEDQGRVNEIFEKLLNWSAGKFDAPGSSEEKPVIDYFKGLADRSEERKTITREISSVFESALNPNRSKRRK